MQGRRVLDVFRFQPCNASVDMISTVIQIHESKVHIGPWQRDGMRFIREREQPKNVRVFLKVFLPNRRFVKLLNYT